MKNEQEANVSIEIMNFIDTGFKKIVSKMIDMEKNQIDMEKNMKEDMKKYLKSTYKAQTKEGKARFVSELNKEGKSQKEIADLLGIKPPRISLLIKESKRNGR